MQRDIYRDRCLHPKEITMRLFYRTFFFFVRLSFIKNKTFTLSLTWILKRNPLLCN